jgi:hypothetical protein
VTIEDRLPLVLAYSRRQQPAHPARVQTILDLQAPQRLRAFSTAEVAAGALVVAHMNLPTGSERYAVECDPFTQVMRHG